LSGSNQPVQPRQTNDLGTLENRCTVGEQQHWHIMDAAKRIRGRRLNDFAAQPMVQTLDEPVASIAQREQLVTGMGEVLSRLQGLMVPLKAAVAISRMFLAIMLFVADTIQPSWR
jgi:hypothetical protein